MKRFRGTTKARTRKIIISKLLEDYGHLGKLCMNIKLVSVTGEKSWFRWKVAVK